MFEQRPACSARDLARAVDRRTFLKRASQSTFAVLATVAAGHSLSRTRRRAAKRPQRESADLCAPPGPYCNTGGGKLSGCHGAHCFQHLSQSGGPVPCLLCLLSGGLLDHRVRGRLLDLLRLPMRWRRDLRLRPVLVWADPAARWPRLRLKAKHATLSKEGAAWNAGRRPHSLPWIEHSEAHRCAWAAGGCRLPACCWACCWLSSSRRRGGWSGRAGWRWVSPSPRLPAWQKPPLPEGST